MSAPRPQPGILEIQPYVGGKAKSADGAPAIKLSANECPLGPSPKAAEAYKAGAATLHRYPDGGSTALRQAIGRFVNRSPDQIVCGAGSDELIALICRAYAGPGHEVVHSAHAFLMYRLNALAAGAVPVAAPEDGITASVDALLARVTSRTRLVFLANPNNPTGTYLPAAEIERLHAGLPEDVLLVLDAAYSEYATAEDYTDGLELADRAHNVVVMHTFSKIFGLAALRLGWLYADPAVVDVMHRVRGPFNVSSPAQEAGLAALEDIEHLKAARAHNDRWLPWLIRELRGLGLEVPDSQGNFVLIRFASEERADAAIAALEAGGVLARNMRAYGLADSVRLTVGLEDENRRALEALGAHLKNGGGP